MSDTSHYKYINANRPPKSTHPKTAENPKGAGRIKGLEHDYAALMPVIFEKLSEGMALKAISCLDGMPSMPTLLKYLNAPEWVEQYEAAKGRRADSYGYRIEDVIEKVESGEYGAGQGRALGELIKTRMAQLAPRKYHDRVITQNVTHKHEIPVRDRLERADQRRLQAPVIDDVEYEVVD